MANGRPALLESEGQFVRRVLIVAGIAALAACSAILTSGRSKSCSAAAPLGQCSRARCHGEPWRLRLWRVYIAIDPAVYRDGPIKLFPIDWHPQIRVTLTMRDH